MCTPLSLGALLFSLLLFWSQPSAPSARFDRNKYRKYKPNTYASSISSRTTVCCTQKTFANILNYKSVLQTISLFYLKMRRVKSLTEVENGKTINLRCNGTSSDNIDTALERFQRVLRILLGLQREMKTRKADARLNCKPRTTVFCHLRLEKKKKQPQPEWFAKAKILQLTKRVQKILRNTATLQYKMYKTAPLFAIAHKETLGLGHGVRRPQQHGVLQEYLFRQEKI